MVDRTLRPTKCRTIIFYKEKVVHGAVWQLARYQHWWFAAGLCRVGGLARWYHSYAVIRFRKCRLSIYQIQPKSCWIRFNLRLNQHLSFSDLRRVVSSIWYTTAIAESQEVNTMVWQYLKGEIDLVYQHGTQFLSSIIKAIILAVISTVIMTQRHYMTRWPRIVIGCKQAFKVALHRYLKLRLPNYDINTHLGAVEYAFYAVCHPNTLPVGSW